MAAEATLSPMPAELRANLPPALRASLWLLSGKLAQWSSAPFSKQHLTPSFFQQWMLDQYA